MSVKKILMMSAASLIACGAAYAGGPGEYSPAPSVAGLYLEGNVGYAWRNWEDMYFWSDIAAAGNNAWDSNSKGGFAAIVDAGYQFNDYFSAELGWIYLTPPKSSIGSNGLGYHLHDGSTWTLYFGGKIQAPIYDDQTFIFGKLAAAYNHNSFNGSYDESGALNQDISSNYWSPLFAAGVQRYFSPNLSANIQYTYIPAYTNAGTPDSSKDFNVPESHILTVGVGYKFLM